jgi:hypothetical protein
MYREGVSFLLFVFSKLLLLFRFYVAPAPGRMGYLAAVER